jgi:acyl-CoA thioesterase I
VTIQIRPATRLLFTGDSITEAGRDNATPNSLGNGFVRMVSDSIAAGRADVGARVFNTGIGGHRIRDLHRRWNNDALALRPHVVTVLIGINDVSRRYDTGDVTTCEEFRHSYADLLRSTAAIGAHVVLIEPFLLPVNQDQVRWREDLDPKIAAVRQLAREFETDLIAADNRFAQTAQATGPTRWCPDGVHPSVAGHQLIAEAWLELLEPEPQ